MPDSPPEEVAETGGPDLISFPDMPARMEAAGLKRVSVQRCRQLAEEDPAWPAPVMKVGRMRLFDWRVVEAYFRNRTSRQGQRPKRQMPPAEGGSHDLAQRDQSDGAGT
ncbi:hypothetical protein ACIOD1_12910 [Streptomyces sp. NPDC088097]|uniref:hypothetical protein n=1 Tax=Streptomyces sp. NPDC088097 TaxID=3365823 RepID=UPI003824816E